MSDRSDFVYNSDIPTQPSSCVQSRTDASHVKFENICGLYVTYKCVSYRHI